MKWRPYLPAPRPAFKMDPLDPEPEPLLALRELRGLCAHFRIPPRQFRTRTSRGIAGTYRVESDIVTVDPRKAAGDGLGGEDGYYALLVHAPCCSSPRQCAIAETMPVTRLVSYDMRFIA
jgi:hypothetical protein